MNPVSLLRSPWAATLALGLCMWAQIPHSQYVFEHWSRGQSGGAFAWGFEAAVLMFVVRNMHVASWIFAGLSALINVGYYGLQGVQMGAYPTSDNWVNWLLSLALPFTIAMYSHVLADATKAVYPLWMHKSVGWVQGYIDSLYMWAQPVAHAPKPKAKPLVAPPVIDPVPVVAQPAEDATTIDNEAQPLAIMPELQAHLAELDETDNKILDALRNGACTPYAISKRTGIALTTLKRKQGDKVTGRLPKLVAAGYIHNSSGADGSEYRING